MHLLVEIQNYNMAITRAQQARQMLKKGGEPVVQGGVENYLGRQPEVQAPRKWQSGPDKPPTELAYITEAEKKLLLKTDIHGSLKEGPNEGPAGIMSLDSFGDIGGAGAGGADTDPGGGYDTGAGGGGFSGQGPGESKQEFEDRKEQQKKDLEKFEKDQADYFKSEEFKKEKKEAAKARKKRLRDDRKKRQQRIRDILSGKFGVNNPFGLNPTELADLKALGYDPTLGLEGIGKELGAPGAIKGPNEFTADVLKQALEKSDRLSGVNLATFQNRPLDAPVPGALLNIAKGLGLLDPKINREFFSDRDYKSIFGKDKKSVLEGGKLTYDGLPVSQSQFEMLSPAEMEEVYGNYMDRRMSGEIDAYGNPTIQKPDDESDPCLGPNPPAYCFTRNEDPTPTAPPVFTPAFRFMNRGGMVEDAPMGGIMDLETARQMLFIGGIAKGISKGLKSVTRGLKKVAKSPLGKAALLGAVGFGIPGTGFGGLFGRASFGGPALGAFGKFGIGPTLFANPTIAAMKTQGLEKGFFPKFFENMTGLKVAGLSGLAGALLANVGKDDDDDFNIEEYYKMAGIDIPENQYRFLAEGGSEDLSKDPNYKGWVKLYEKNPDIAAMNDKHKEYLTFYQREQNKQAEGSREPVAKKTMPLLDLEGQEMDFRQDGGFVPIGRMEKADDVPARLSKNEFVFTADAVRNAGGGDVDKGAEVMYNTMKNLEAGGEVSEETQGLEGARKMFQTSQRLGEVI